MSIDKNISNPTKSVGIEIARHKIRVCVLGADGSVIDYAEAPRASLNIEGVDSLSDVTQSLEATWKRLDLDSNARVGVAIGTGYSGVGSGPAMHPWLDALERKISQKVSRVGTPNDGISYVPLAHVQELKMMFGNLGSQLSLVEVAPVAVARLLGENGTGVLEFNSSVAWKTRVHKGSVLEAIASEVTTDNEEVLVTSVDGTTNVLTNRSGYTVDIAELNLKGLSVSKIAVALGSAIGVRTGSPQTDLAGILDLRELESEQRRSIFATPSMTTQELQVVEVSSSATPDSSLASVIAASEIDTSWPVSSEMKAVPVPAKPKGENFGLDSKFNEAAFLDLTSESDVGTPSVPPASNQLPTFVESLNLPPMPSENTRLDNPIISVAPSQQLTSSSTGTNGQSMLTLGGLDLQEDSIVRVLVGLIAGVLMLLFLLVVFG